MRESTLRSHSVNTICLGSYRTSMKSLKGEYCRCYMPLNVVSFPVSASCKKRLDSTSCNEHDDQVYCNACYRRQFGPRGYGFASGGAGLSTDGGGSPEVEGTRSSVIIGFQVSCCPLIHTIIIPTYLPTYTYLPTIPTYL